MKAPGKSSLKTEGD